MDPVKMRCQSITKTKGKTHEVVQFYAVGADAKLGTPAMQITSDTGEYLFGKFIPGGVYSFLLEDATPPDAKPVVKEEQEETTTITEADVVEDAKKVAPESSAPAT